MTASMFSETKSAQMAAYFLHKNACPMPYLKLLKLLYLADRETMRLTGDSMSGDHFVSMPHGPVLSRTYELINQSASSDLWDVLIAPDRNWKIKLRKAVERESLDELSDQDVSILDSIFQRFGSMHKWALRDWTHEHCGEWQDPDGSSFPIKPEAIFRAVGCTEADAATRAASYRERRELDRALSRYL